MACLSPSHYPPPLAAFVSHSAAAYHHSYNPSAPLSKSTVPNHSSLRPQISSSTLFHRPPFSQSPPPQLPSEIWQFVVNLNRAEFLRSILRVGDCNLLHLYGWIMANSPRYGLVIDCAMRDHVTALVKFSLKVIVREAVDLAGIMYGDGEMKEMEKALPGLGNQCFERPVLVRVMVSVLYGEVNGKNFAIDLLKDLCIACWCKVLDQLMVARQSIECETVGNSVIFIS